MTLPAPNPCELRPLVKSDPLNAKPLEISTTENKLRTTNEKFIKNMSNSNLTDQEIALLAQGLKFIPTPIKPASQKNLMRDFNSFARSMRLKYKFADSKSNPTSFPGLFPLTIEAAARLNCQREKSWERG